jgi:TonB family protein
MENLLPYLIRASAGVIIFYICYQLVLRKQAYFTFNRAYLLTALAASAILPFVSLDLVNLFNNYGSPIPNVYLEYQTTAIQLNEVVIGDFKENSSGINPLGIALLVYLSGVAIKLIQFLFRLAQLYRLSSRYGQRKLGRLVLVVTREGTPTFSFLNYIFIAPENCTNEQAFRTIIKHEKVHSDELHTVDLLITELMVMLLWFNPFVYLLRNLIKENHEFLADRLVLSNDHDYPAYSILLMEHASMIKTNMLTHNFSYSLVKRRLLMMKKTKNPIRFGLALFGVVAASLIVMMACSRTDGGTGQLGEGLLKSSADSVYTEADLMPEFPGGMDSLIAYLSNNITYPAEAKENGISGKVMVKFVIDESGSVTDVNVMKGIGSGCDEEAARVIQNMPDWTPGVKDGSAVKVSYVLPISFNLGNNEKKEVFTVVEQMPKYPGGFDALVEFLSENIRYPEQAKKDSITGKVFVSFVVMKDGSVSDVGILRGIGGGCDEEAVRVVSMMPNWEPGLEKGKAVNVKYNLPIKFALN